jgi:hypothetical protein
LWDDKDNIPLGSIEEYEERQEIGCQLYSKMLFNSSGLPFEERKMAWIAWSGAKSIRGLYCEDHYEHLCARWELFESSRREPETAQRLGFTVDFVTSVDVIGRDLKRTCQEHHYFSDSDGLICLERLLVISLLHNSGIFLISKNRRPTALHSRLVMNRTETGYTQGMNFLAAFLLLTLQLSSPGMSDGLLGRGYVTPQVTIANCFPFLMQNYPNLNMSCSIALSSF